MSRLGHLLLVWHCTMSSPLSTLVSLFEQGYCSLFEQGKVAAFAQPGIKPGPPALEAWRLSPWGPREVPSRTLNDAAAEESNQLLFSYL